MTNSELLLIQLRDRPADLTLLSAFHDALYEEEDYAKAERAAKLLELEQRIRGQSKADSDLSFQRDFHRYHLKVKTPSVGDLVASDSERRVFPVTQNTKAVGVIYRVDKEHVIVSLFDTPNYHGTLYRIELSR